MKEKLFYVKTGLGCGIRSDISKEQVYKDELVSVGSYNGIQEVRKATKEDIDWIKAMGGHIPKGDELNADL